MSSRFDLWAALRIAFGETFYMVLISLIISVVIGTLIGYLLYATSSKYLILNKSLNSVLGFVINCIRSLPFIILLIVLLPLSKIIVGTQVGASAVIVPLSISSSAFFSRLAESSFNSVNKGVIEYAISTGASGRRIFFSILLPEASSQILSAVTVCTIALLGSSAMAGTIGGGGVGDLAIRYGYQRYQTDILIICVVLLIIIVQGIQFLGDYVSRRANKS
ncbi:MAG TPA: methionine ABC transporter permease [Ruminiclostridium sp.]